MGVLINYKDFKEKEENFNRYTIRTKKEFDRFFKVLIERDSDSIWRGMSESKFKHYTSLQRFWLEKDLPKDRDEVIKYIKHIISYARIWNSDFFGKYFKNYGIGNFSAFSALSILRHHGSPTPLIDWTRNPLIGLFFATYYSSTYQSDAEIDQFFSLYEIKSSHYFYQNSFKKYYYEYFKKNESDIRKQNREHKGDPDFVKKFTQAYINDDELFYNRLKKSPMNIIQDLQSDEVQFYINNNYNITNQEGLFILNSYPNLPLEEGIIYRAQEINLISIPQEKIKEKLKTHNQNFVCYDIHKSLNEYVLRLLKAKNIDEKYIFPDLNSLAQECVKSYLMSDSD